MSVHAYADGYDCPECGVTHKTTTDTDGYTLSLCPLRGTMMVATPGSN